MDRLGVAAVEVEGEFGQAQLPDVVVAEDRLRRVVEDVEHVVLLPVEQPLERHQPARLEVLALVDDDRVVARPEPFDRRVEPVRQRLLEPLGGDRIRLGRQRPGLAPEVLGQLVEGPHPQMPGPRRDVERLVEQQPRERRVEAHEQGVEALGRELLRLGDGEHRLARPGATDDGRPPRVAQRVQQVQLLIGQAHDLAVAVGDLAPKERSKLERRGHHRGQDLDALDARPSLRPRIPQLEAAIDPFAQLPIALRVGCQERLVEDQLRVGVGAHQDLRVEAGEVDVRERDGVAGDRIEPRLPGRVLLELGDETVVAVGRLLERGSVELADARPPPTLAVAPDLAGLHLDRQEAELRVGDDEVGLALALDPMVAHQPGDVGEHRVLGREGGAEAVEHVPFGARPEAVVRLAAQQSAGRHQ